MSYAIIRNEKYKRENLKGIYRHNERRNKNYSNKNIDKSKSHLNYSIKEPTYSYEKEFDTIREKYNLKGQVKTVSNIVCEYIITSDKEFFESIGEKETKRYFETAYKFVCEYKNLSERYILSAKVQLDEETPHLYLAFIPVVHTTDKKGNTIDKAEKLENERQLILQEKVNLENKCVRLEKNFHNKETELKRNFNKKYDELLSENIYLNKIINTFEKTIKKFISWVCNRFAVSEEGTLITDFQQETNTFINPIKQIEYEKEQEEFEL